MSPTLELILLALLAGFLVALGVWTVRLVRVAPAERERRRRLQVNRCGRMSDGMLTDVSADTLYFSYSVRGVEYTASQEVTSLRELLPEDRDSLIGAVTLKYLPRNPANSIVVCEEWSGLRRRESTHPPVPEQAEAPPGTLIGTPGNRSPASFGHSAS